MVFKYQIAPSTNPNPWTIKIYEDASYGPGAEIYTIPVAAPHSAIETIEQSGLDTVTHRVVMKDDVTAQVLHDFIFEATVNIVQAFAPIRFKIGDGAPLTPLAGTDTYYDPILVGRENYIAHRANYGPLYPNVNYQANPITGTFNLIAPDVFGEGEEITIDLPAEGVSNTINDSVVGKWFGSFVNISTNTSYSATHLRKLLRFTNTCNYTFTGTIPVGYGFCFNNQTADKIGTITFSNGTLKVLGGTVGSITLLPSFSACFSWDGGNWNIVYYTKSEATAAGKGTIIEVGEYTLPARGFGTGDLPVSPQVYEIVHGKAIAGDYTVLVSVKHAVAASIAAPGTSISSLRVALIWFHHTTDKANRFCVALTEYQALTQNIIVSWVLIKL